ncbi:MAG: CarD family transcriptional regulator [Desulfuromonadaceae bacterium]|nr:CarD family transcriptional regulator [Desulfuromonadaceae bacterium]MDF1580016.1 CarD family transcriptional regulator [Desulfuromonadales bacterium]MDT8423042.1 CarD family transcriptional regulator [Desulfuromonadales bacterium]
MFKVGDMAVYPSQGVGIVEAIESRDIGGSVNNFYVLRIVDNDMTIMIPVNNVAQVGLRTLIDRGRISSVYKLLEEKLSEIPATISWSRRQREYNDKIKSGDLFEVAEVLRELYMIKEGKELSYGEKKVLELARRLLVKELALAQGQAEDMVVKRVENIFIN